MYVIYTKEKNNRIKVFCFECLYFIDVLVNVEVLSRDVTKFVFDIIQNAKVTNTHDMMNRAYTLPRKQAWPTPLQNYAINSNSQFIISSERLDYMSSSLTTRPQRLLSFDVNCSQVCGSGSLSLLL